MPEIYNLTNLTEATNIGAQVQALNSLSGSIFGIVFLITFALIIFVAVKKYDKDFKESFLASMAITTVVAFGFLTFGLIFWQIFAICLALLIGAILIYQFS